MYNFASTQRPPFSILEGARDDALSPEAASRILARVMATIRSNHTRRELAKLRLMRMRFRHAEAAEIAQWTPFLGEPDDN